MSKLPFTGELMVCAMCKKQEQSSIDRSTEWRLIEIDGLRHYVCPRHFPPDGSSAKAFSLAYERILRRLIPHQ